MRPQLITPKNSWRLTLLGLAVWTIAAGWPNAAPAAVVSSATSGDWSSTGTWTGGTIPASPTNAALISNATTVTVTGAQTAGDGAANPAVEVANGGTLNITGTSNLAVQSGFNFRIDAGGAANITSTSASALTTAGAGAIQIGTSSTSFGVLTQTGGTITTAAALAIGAVNTGSKGKYDMQGGTFSGATISIGERISSVGELNVSGAASISVGFNIIGVGNNSSSTGTINMTGGSISSTSTLNLGGNGNATGTVNQSGGTIVIGSSAGGMTVGSFGAGSLGIYNLSGTGLFAIRDGSGGNITVGNVSTSVNNNQFNMTGGTVRLGGGGSASNITAGNTVPLDSIIVGNGGTGTWDQSAGNVVWKTSANVATRGGIIVGNTSTAIGEFKLSGTGTVTTSDLGVANAGDVLVGKASASGTPGKWTQSGGTLTVASSSLIRVGGDSLNVNASVSNPLVGFGQVAFTGGTINTPSVLLGDTAGSSGTWTQSGGTLNVTSINQAGTGNSAFNLSGTGVVNLTGQWTDGGGADTRSLTGGTLNTKTGNDIRILLVNAGSTISPGSLGTAGTTTFTTSGGNFRQDSGTLLLDIRGNSTAQFDRLLLTSIAGQTATFNGGLVSIVIPPDSIGTQVTPGIFDLVIADTVTINTLPTLVFSDPHFQGFLSFANTGGALLAGQESLRLTLTNVPEPAAAMILLIGTAALNMRRCKRANV